VRRDCSCARYPLPTRLKTLALRTSVRIYRNAGRNASVAVASAVIPAVIAFPWTRAWRARRLRYFSSRQINFHRGTPCLSTKAAGRTIENLAGGFVVADFSFHGAACATLPCFRCPRGRRARLFVHLGLQRPPRYPPISTLSPAAIPPSRAGVCKRVHARLCTCLYVSTSTYMHVYATAYIHMYVPIYMQCRYTPPP
jgi:hypothetical protein